MTNFALKNKDKINFMRQSNFPFIDPFNGDEVYLFCCKKMLRDADRIADVKKGISHMEAIHFSRMYTYNVNFSLILVVLEYVKVLGK